MTIPAELPEYDRPRYTEDEAAARLRPHKPVSREAMRKYRRTGQLAFFRIFGSVFYSDRQLDEFLARCKRG